MFVFYTSTVFLKEKRYNVIFRARFFERWLNLTQWLHFNQVFKAIQWINCCVNVDEKQFNNCLRSVLVKNFQPNGYINCLLKNRA